MSRASYGADVFSPVKGNTSINDDGLCIGRESDFLKDWQEPHYVTKKSEAKRENLPFFNTDQVSFKDDLQSSIKINKIVEKKSKKNLLSETDVGKLSHVTTRRCKSSHNSKKELGIIQENQSSGSDKVPRTRKNNNNVTVRAEVESSKELRPNKIKHKKNSSLCVVNYVDSNKELLPNKIKENASSLSLNLDNSKKELLSNKLVQNGDPSLTLINSIDSKKELSFQKINKNNDSSSSSVSLADSVKDISASKIMQVKDFSSSSVDPADSNKELSFKKVKKIKDLSPSSINHDGSDKEISSSSIKHSKDFTSLSFNPADSSEKSFSNKVNSDKYSFTPSLVSLAFNLDISSSKSENNLDLSEEQSKTSKVLINNSNEKSMKFEKDSKVSTEKCAEIETPVFPSVSKDDNLMSGEENRDFTIDEKVNVESSVCLSDSKCKQVQANVIEKLVKDAVSFEFDRIRQMLYNQHLQLMRYIDRSTVTYQQQKIIEELLEENSRLKNIIAQKDI